MKCPNCGTWNPDDKKVCWRCQTPLPSPEEKKPKRTFTIMGMSAWLFVLILVMLALPLLMGRCGTLPH